ncbi:TPA: hypothetical protein ACF3R9_003761 [Serratia marcescens]
MAKAWKDVIASPQYQQLTPEQQSAAQSQYFNEVVAPKAGDQVDAARQQFYSAYPLPAQPQPQPQPQSSPAVSQEENARQENVVNNANGFDRFMFGVLNGLMDVGKGVGLFKDMTPEEQAAIKSVQQKLAAKPSTSQDVGEFVGQAAPFLGGGGLISQVPRGAARLGAAAGLGAAEGGVVAKGTGNDIATGATVGAIAGPISELAAPIVGKAANAIGDKFKAEAGQLYRSARGLGGEGAESTIKKAEAATQGAGLLGSDKALRGFANEVMPDESAVKAIKDLGLEGAATPGMVSNNPSVRALENAVASLPGTQISESHKRYISELGKRADELITSFGGDLDKQAVSSRVAANFDKTITDLQNRSDAIYNQVSAKVPVRSRVEPSNSMRFLEEHADDLGGIDELSPILKRTMLRLDPNTMPTYGRLDNVRKQIGQAIGNKNGHFKDEETGILKGLYSAITDDQQSVAEKYGAGELWNLGKQLVKTRKGVEDQAVSILGKNLDQAVVPKVEAAITRMAQGNGSDFSSLMKSIPEDMRKEVVLTSMNKAFTSFAKSPGQQFGVDGFVKWYNGMQRSPTNNGMLRNALGKDASKRLDTIYQAAKIMNRLNQGKQYASSLVDQQINNFLKDDGGLARMYGIAKKAMAAEGVSSSLGVPGAGAAVVISGALSAGRKGRIQATDELLSSPEFKSMLFRMSSDQAQRPEVRKAVERKVMQSKEFKKWASSLPTEDINNLARVGLVSWLANGGSTEIPDPTKTR